MTTVPVSAPPEGLDPRPIVACHYRLIMCTTVKSTCFGLDYSAGFAIMSKRRPHSIFERWRLNLVRFTCMMVFAPPPHTLPRSCREGRTPWLYTYLTFFPRILARETRLRTTWAWLAQGRGGGGGGGGRWSPCTLKSVQFTSDLRIELTEKVQSGFCSIYDLMVA